MVATERGLATVEKSGGLAVQWEPDEIDVIKNVLCKGITDNELKLFAYQCQRTGLDPFTRQIHAIKRGSGDRASMTIQIGIDGLRLIAERTGRYCPGRAPTFTYDDKGNLVSATAYVLKLAGGSWLEVSATAFFAEYVQVYDGKPTGLWAKMPHGQTAKCAEALVLRRAFPNETSGAHANVELEQADEAAPAGEPVIIRQESQTDAERAASYQAKYFAIAEGTSFYEKPGRSAFIVELSGGQTSSLTEYLSAATPEAAATMIGMLKAKVDAERAAQPDPDTGEIAMTPEEQADASAAAADALKADLFGVDEPQRDYEHEQAAEARAEERRQAKQAAKAEPKPDTDFNPADVKPWFVAKVKERGASGSLEIRWDRARQVGDLLSDVLQSVGAGIDIARFLTDNPKATYASLTEGQADLLEKLANIGNAKAKLMQVHELAEAWAVSVKAAAAPAEPSVAL